jgi:hypothetical protein
VLCACAISARENRVTSAQAAWGKSGARRSRSNLEGLRDVIFPVSCLFDKADEIPKSRPGDELVTDWAAPANYTVRPDRVCPATPFTAESLCRTQLWQLRLRQTVWP